MTTLNPLPKKQRGTVLIMAAFTSVALFGFMGIALNISHAYDLKSELQNMADAAALSGAKSLNGTVSGVNTAVSSAKATAAANKFNFSTTLALTDANIGFADNPDSNAWLTVSQALAAPSGLLFIKVNTGAQTSVIGNVANFMKVAGVTDALSTAGSAVAGRFSLAISPIAICAIETTKYGQLAHAGLPDELKEFGYRRGLSYNIIDINPLGGASQKFLLNPVDIPPGPGDASACTPSNSSAASVAPYMCGGTASIITTIPGYVYVNTGFSSTLEKELNSRFNTYGGGSACTPAGAPPDSNIKEYSATSNAAGMPKKWMSDPGQQAVTLQTSPKIPLAPPVPRARDYGVLWSYNSAVHYAATPPAGGYTPYTTANWSLIYPTTTAPTPTALAAYPNGAPYHQASGSQFTAPPASNAPGVKDRRVLNLAIVDCNTLSSSGGSSCKTIKVLGIGRFFMTVPASLPSAINTEFAGLVPDSSLTSEIRLYK